MGRAGEGMDEPPAASMVAEDKTPMFSAMPEDLVFPCIQEEAYCWRKVKDCSASAMVSRFD